LPNGGTWLGYTLGTIGALLIVWLMWFGIRKRRYGTNIGTTRGWLSAHVYLGTSLILIACCIAASSSAGTCTRFALVLMLIVIFSGFFGVYAYLRYPTLMTRNRETPPATRCSRRSANSTRTR
jgi:cytochrome bd-type quinol oxidase subunit 2